MRGVGREHLRAAVAALLVVGAREQDARELAVRARARLQRDVRQPRDLGERVLELPHQPQRALGAARRLRRVQARVPRQRRDALVQLGVVLHRARAERIEARVEVEVALREPVVVADDLGLGDLRQPRRLGAAHARGQELVERALGDVQRRGDERAAAGPRALVDRQHAVALHRRLVQRRLAHDVAPAGVRPAARSAATASPSTSARRSMSAFERCSVSATSSPSACSG